MRTKIIKRHIEQKRRPKSSTESLIEIVDDEDSATFGVDKESLPLSLVTEKQRAITNRGTSTTLASSGVINQIHLRKSILNNYQNIFHSNKFKRTASAYSGDTTDTAKDLSLKGRNNMSSGGSGTNSSTCNNTGGSGQQNMATSQAEALSSHQYFSLRWNNYQSNMTSVFHRLLETEAFVDVTLACENNYLKAHKVVLSACSGFFQRILLDNPCKHPTIIMPSDIAFSDLQFIIDFVYRGEIDVSEAELQSLLQTAEKLKIKGLCEVNDHSDNPLEYISYNRHHQHHQQQQQQQQQRQHQHQHHHHQSRGYKRPASSTPQKGPVTRSKAQAAAVQDSTGSKGDGQPLTTSDTDKVAAAQGGGTDTTAKNMATNISMGISNGGMGPSMSFLDFPPEPPAPTATPVTEHVDLNISHSHDTRDISNQGYNNFYLGSMPIGETRAKFETLKSLDTSDSIDIENNLSSHQIQHQMHIVHHAPLTQATIVAATSQHMMDHSGRQSVHSVGSPSQPQTPQHPPAVSTPNSNEDSNQSLMDVKPIINHQTHQIITTPPVSSAQGNNSGSGVGNGGDSESSQQQQQQQQQLQQFEHDSSHGMVVMPEIANMMNTQPHMDIYNSDNSTNEDIKQEPNYNNTNMGEKANGNGNGNGTATANSAGSKVWTPEDMDAALEALKNHSMSLTKASAHYGIPSTTLWQRAHRLGIDTPKKEGPTKTWNEDSLNSALEALRTGTISANKASKAYGIPSSTLYKIARREGIRLAAPFNAAPTNWSAEDLERALEAIRAGQTSVQKASTEFGIPTGTLYGRCKREGIELSRSNPTPWSEDAMMEALEAVRVGHMSINQAAIHYNLPYSSLYGRFKRGRYDNGGNDGSHTEHSPENTMQYTPPPPQMHHQGPPPTHQVVTSPPPSIVHQQQQQQHHQHHLQPLPHYQPHHQQSHQSIPSSSQVVLNNHHSIIYHESS